MIILITIIIIIIITCVLILMIMISMLRIPSITVNKAAPRGGSSCGSASEAYKRGRIKNTKYNNLGFGGTSE